MSSPTTSLDCKPVPESVPPVEPCTLVIFGGSGDLARRRLIPAVYNLLLDGLLPAKYAVIGLGRKPMTDDEFRALVREGVVTHSRQALVQETWDAFQSHLFYIQGENEDPQTYQALRAKAEQVERDMHLPGNRIFYLSIPPVPLPPSVRDWLTRGWRHQRAPRPPTRASSSKSRWVAISLPLARSTK